MAFAAFASALALLASGPSSFAIAQADPPPGAAQSTPAAKVDGEDPFPSGAPTDDYGFMGWCYGALAGHMALYTKVLPSVRSIEAAFPDSSRPIDEVMADYTAQHVEGDRLLRSWDRALSVLETTGRTHGLKRTAVVAKGREVWRGSDAADARQLAQLWMSWGLPGRCSSTAERLAPRAK